MIVETDIDCTRGDTAEWDLTATLDNVPVDLTGGKVWMTARWNWASPPIFQKTSDPGGGITIVTPQTDPDTGKAIIVLAVEDTTVLSNQDNVLVYDIRVRTAAGREFVVVKGKLTVGADASL